MTQQLKTNFGTNLSQTPSFVELLRIRREIHQDVSPFFNAVRGIRNHATEARRLNKEFAAFYQTRTSQVQWYIRSILAKEAGKIYGYSGLKQIEVTTESWKCTNTLNNRHDAAYKWLSRAIANPEANVYAFDYPVHAARAALPMEYTKADTRLLRDSMKVYGLLDPILTFNGKIFDGIARLQICREIGIEPRFLEKESDWSHDEMIDHIAESILPRIKKTITASQMALWIAKNHPWTPQRENRQQNN